MKSILTTTAIFIALITTAFADPELTSWLTAYSAQYARAYTNTSMRSSGTTVTKWSGQSLPSYADIGFVASSPSWVYVRGADLPSYVIGPWLNPQGQPGTLYPANQHELERFPRSPAAQSGTKTISGTGYSGLYVNGVAVFNFTDGKAWDPTNLVIASGPHNKATYYWHRNAPVGEGFNFDYPLGHQNPAGVYHSHQEPIALRYELGDHVDFNSTTKNYSESTNTPTQHSPILGWAYDGYPIYGPYGYSVSNDASSGIRRMVSGYVLRTGANGTDNLTNNLNVIPAWYARYRQAHFGEAYSTSTTQTRPSVSGTNYLGTFAEDYAYYGDLTNSATGQLYVMGTNTFDLDVYNGRWCVTPEFPGGTYAYFLDIDASGTPAYPYAIAYEYYGVASGGSVSSISETVTTNFHGAADTALTLNTPAVNTNNNLVTLVWSSTEGGTYEVESSTDQNTWTVENANVAAAAGVSTTTNYISSITNGTVYVRVTRTALASYDDAAASSGVVGQTNVQSFALGNGGATNSAPAITTNPTNESICAGQSAGFVAAATGSPMPSVQWQVKTNGGSLFTDIPGATNTTYSVTAASADNGSQFQAVFSNAVSKATTTAATLTVNALPDATITPSSTSVSANSATNTASAPYNTTATYSWSIANGTISSGANAQTITYTAGVSGNVQLILVAANSSGCTASNSLLVPILSGQTNSSPASDPQLTSWLTAYAGRYARIYTNDLSRTNGVSVTTWTNPTVPSLAQTLPTYVGVQEVDYSSNWIYVRTPDLAEYIMGPWYNDSTRTATFINWPTNQHVLYLVPRTSTLSAPPATKTTTYGGVDAIGCFVNGVMMFDALDGFVWNGSTETMGGSGQWRRAAYPNEGPTLDPGNSHQQNTGEYHNHADPIALRYTLGDHVDFNPVSKIYTESTNPPTKHSPILGWVRDGYPLYGPYGYSNPTNPASGIRRMVSGYQLRNGQNGSDNITNVGRATLPAWMLRNNGNTAASGPSVSSTYPAGRYLQDYAYLGDLTNAVTHTNYQLGVDFDLNEFDCRWCVTPEFPNGTWAYFVTIDSNGVPIAPWNVGTYFFGKPTGYKGTNITETVVTNFVGVPHLTPVLASPSAGNGTVTLTWSATEGGTYRVESSTNLTAWTTNSTSVQAVLNRASYTNNVSDPHRFYRVAQTALAAYDPLTITNSGGGSGGTALITMSPNAGNRGQTYTVIATLSSSANPPPPPQSGAPVQTFTVGSISVTGASYTYSNGTGTVTGTLTIPAGASTGPQTVTITFSPPPGQSSGPSYTQANGFTVN